ncbi:MAG: exodeoxyribonuclease V subunit alpha [Deltaproteobacteria bacterium]|nr:exodeoxyribonuclease V subunit alpha [Deltaproteobacteria bacterium]
MDLPNHDVLEPLRQAGVLGELDIRFAGLMAKLAAEEASEELFLASALTSRSTRAGHVCLDLERAEEIAFPEGRPTDLPPFPPGAAWAERLVRIPVVGPPGEFTPLVLDECARLYLHRYWSYQETLIRWIRKHGACEASVPRPGALRHALDRLFPREGAGSGVDWQKVAACTAFLRRFTVISGGPGTGKTTTVTRILALFHELSGQQGHPLRISLAAPTGKAAARLGETVHGAAHELFDPGSGRVEVLSGAATLHRLLGTKKGSPYFRHNAAHRLPLDVLVVDEASMVDLALMAKLVQALPPGARLILLGDRDQLASVEAGAVLGDICGGDREPGFSPSFRSLLERETGERIPEAASPPGEGPVQDGVVLLRKSRRFGEKSGLGRLARFINKGDEDGVMALLREGAADDVSWSPLPKPGELAGVLRKSVLDPFAEALNASTPARALERFDRFRILCALREGPYGVTAVNALVERVLAEEDLIRLQGPWYRGRPLLVTRNDYELQLFNGDVGVILPQEGRRELRACFPAPGGALRSIHPLRLPQHETAFAVTVHKSQGSEFEHVLLVLPDRPSPIMTRELLYTAVTRAKASVEIRAPESIIRAAVSRRTRRSSGLEDALWKA